MEGCVLCRLGDDLTLVQVRFGDSVRVLSFLTLRSNYENEDCGPQEATDLGGA